MSTKVDLTGRWRTLYGTWLRVQRCQQLEAASANYIDLRDMGNATSVPGLILIPALLSGQDARLCVVGLHAELRVRWLPSVHFH
jgi:hypothetical protein